ncbi:GTP pyrophosphokinase family protein [Atopobacter sp. AH10]|uniref:GTP pyrophosphokinase n=1 Tax=Atopobacter sp. AH10 TaxID=2315861 RepID=UPI000EF20978|nr:GTP pyrophosphokinase family protein [Atopobacter sp. AH10]RLK64298.1 GTP pyrophosphokinase family protein [Atopobacter sp. AH10]
MEPFTADQIQNWEEFLAPYEQAVAELKVKLKGIRNEYRRNERHAPIEFITARVKTVNSIVEKVNSKHISLYELEDIGGLRIMCQFVDDIYETVALLRQRKDFVILAEEDYIAREKASGYRSYHVTIKYPVERMEGLTEVVIEIQIRTLAMNFWATIEHSLNYKYKGHYSKELQDRLKRAGEAAFLLDNEMSAIREEIQKAQQYFQRYREK